MAEGLQWLRDVFGDDGNVTIGWQLDPFGHTNSNARYYSEMGFDALFFMRTPGRITGVNVHQINTDISTREEERMWANSPSMGRKTDLFTSSVHFYGAGCVMIGGENDFVWCGEIGYGNSGPEKTEPTRDDWFSYVVPWLKYQCETSDKWHGQILVPWGTDFAHPDAQKDYKWMDKAIDFINANHDELGVGSVFYSSPKQYVDAVYAHNYTFNRRSFDYLPLYHEGEGYWTGFYTSVPRFKGVERYAMNQLSAVDIAMSTNPHGAPRLASIQAVDALRQQQGLNQHHDTVTGTSDANVRPWYFSHTASALDTADTTVADSLGEKGAASTACHNSLIGVCPATAGLASGQSVAVQVFNQLAQRRTEIIRVPVPTKNASVAGIGADLQQVTALWEMTEAQDKGIGSIEGRYPYELAFQLELPPLTTVTVSLLPLQQSASSKVTYEEVLLTKKGDFNISQGPTTVFFDGRTGAVKSMETDIQSMDVKLHYGYYEMDQKSGAYIVQTVDDNLRSMRGSSKKGLLVRGPLCSEYRQYNSDDQHIHTAWRVCRPFHDFVEVTSGIGSLTVPGGAAGMEVMMVLSTGLENKGTWYTDSQGLEVVQRVNCTRPWHSSLVPFPTKTCDHQIIGSNLYPANVFSYIRDEAHTSASNVDYFGVIGDRSRGVLSKKVGDLQFLVHRRAESANDNLGAEVLRDSDRIVTTSRLVTARGHAPFNQILRRTAQATTYPPLVRYSSSVSSTTHSIPTSDHLLPPQIHLHTMSVVKPGRMVLRLQHIYAIGDGAGLGVPVSFDVMPLLRARGATWLEGATLSETDITATQPVGDLDRMPWNTCDLTTGSVSTVPPNPLLQTEAEEEKMQAQEQIVVGAEIGMETVNITMNPMDIRTFVVAYSTDVDASL